MTRIHKLNQEYGFQRAFERSNGNPIEYSGRIIQLFDLFPVKYGERLQIVVESVNSDYPQVIQLEGRIVLDGERHEKSCIYVDSNKLPFETEVTSRKRNGYLWVCNGWTKSTSHRKVDWSEGGAAMIVEELSNGRRYNCNDFQLNDDFNDLIFRIERVKGDQEFSKKHRTQ